MGHKRSSEIFQVPYGCHVDRQKALAYNRYCKTPIGRVWIFLDILRTQQTERICQISMAKPKLRESIMDMTIYGEQKEP